MRLIYFRCHILHRFKAKSLFLILVRKRGSSYFYSIIHFLSFLKYNSSALRNASSTFNIPYVSLPNFNGEDDLLIAHHLNVTICEHRGRTNLELLSKIPQQSLYHFQSNVFINYITR